MAASLVFLGVRVSFFFSSMYIERKNPLNKIRAGGTIFMHDLVPIAQPNRQLRRGFSKEKAVIPLPPRRVLKGQLAIELSNYAPFPLELMVFDAKTKVAGKTPPRSTFPKSPVLVQPGETVLAHDDPIDLGIPCGTIEGEMDIVVKYGLPGRPKYELVRKGNVTIFFEPDGFLKGVYFSRAPNA